MNVINLDVVYAARSGELETLAKYLEEGGYITEEIVEFLVLYLRGEINLKRGNKRTYSQYMRDQHLALEVWSISLGDSISIGKALDIYSRKHDVNYETAKSAYKRSRKHDPRFE